MLLHDKSILFAIHARKGKAPPSSKDVLSERYIQQ